MLEAATKLADAGSGMTSKRIMSRKVKTFQLPLDGRSFHVRYTKKRGTLEVRGRQAIGLREKEYRDCPLHDKGNPGLLFHFCLEIFWNIRLSHAAGRMMIIEQNVRES